MITASLVLPVCIRFTENVYLFLSFCDSGKCLRVLINISDKCCPSWVCTAPLLPCLAFPTRTLHFLTDSSKSFRCPSYHSVTLNWLAHISPTFTFLPLFSGLALPDPPMTRLFLSGVFMPFLPSPGDHYHS